MLEYLSSLSFPTRSFLHWILKILQFPLEVHCIFGTPGFSKHRYCLLNLLSTFLFFFSFFLTDDLKSFMQESYREDSKSNVETNIRVSLC